MQVRFIGQQPEEISLEQLPASQRTYASDGAPVEYPGRPFVRAVFGEGRELQHIYAVATITKGETPPISSTGHGVGLNIGDSSWERPFGAAIPQAFTLGSSRNLCQFPSGLSDWDFPFPCPTTRDNKRPLTWVTTDPW